MSSHRWDLVMLVSWTDLKPTKSVSTTDLISNSNNIIDDTFSKLLEGVTNSLPDVVLKGEEVSKSIVPFLTEDLLDVGNLPEVVPNLLKAENLPEVASSRETLIPIDTNFSTPEVFILESKEPIKNTKQHSKLNSEQIDKYLKNVILDNTSTKNLESKDIPNLFIPKEIISKNLENDQNQLVAKFDQLIKEHPEKVISFKQELPSDTININFIPRVLLKKLPEIKEQNYSKDQIINTEEIPAKGVIPRNVDITKNISNSGLELFSKVSNIEGMQNIEEIQGVEITPESKQIFKDDKDLPVENLEQMAKLVKASGIKAFDRVKNMDGFVELTDLKRTNSKQIVELVSKYATKLKINNIDHLNLVLEDKSLGKLKLHLLKVENNSNNFELRIMAGKLGHEFFSKNHSAIVSDLRDKGVELELKVNFFSAESGDQLMYTDRDTSAREDSLRRQRLWQEYQERLYA